MKQLTISFPSGRYRPARVHYSQADIAFFESTPLLELPSSFLMESRAQRIGCSLDELQTMRSYDLARELADETAILGSGPLSRTCQMPATRLDDRTLDAAVKRVAAERAEAWKEFLKGRQL